METPVLIALLVAMVVAFFGWQWFSRRRSSAGTGISKKGAPLAATAHTAEKPLAPVVAAAAAPPKQEAYPEVVGQTEADLRAKEPLQQQPPAASAVGMQPPAGPPRPQPVSADGMGPANIEDNLRHPEQAFHQPGPKTGPASDIAAGRAATTSTPGFASMGPEAPPMGAHQQGFVPEMAQNGGTLFGGSVFAYDGMEPTSFAAF